MPHELKENWAYVLAVKLRNRGVYASAQDVREWPARSIRLAIVWTDRLDRGERPGPWKEYMGDDLPPPSSQAWLPISGG